MNMDVREGVVVLSSRNKFLLILAISLFLYLFYQNEQTTKADTSQIKVSLLSENHTEHQENTTTFKTILFWTKFYKSRDFSFGLGQEPFHKKQCPVTNCRTTNDRAELSSADAVVFSLFGNAIANRHYKLPVRMRSHQIYVMVLVESPIRTFYDIGKFKDQFNLTFTYLNHSETDIFAPRVKFVKKVPADRTIDRDAIIKRKTRLVAWVVSNCKAPSQRSAYVRELQRYLRVDVYGRCGNHSCPRDVSCFTSISRRYKFYLAFENSYCQDYITEKVYRTLGLDLVPVVLGGANYTRLLPPRSFIDVAEFPSPGHLAQYLLSLDRDDREYLEYLDWKERYDMVTGYRSTGFCKLCEILHDSSYPYKSGFDPSKYWDGTRWCLKNEAERQAIHLDIS